MKVLHITTHMGGGAGKAIAGMAISCNKIEGQEHKILVLEKPEKQQHIENCQQNNTKVLFLKNKKEIERLITWADIIVISWWQHPKMAGFLANFPNVSCRIVIWSHINGCVYPYLPYELVEQTERILFTTAYSLENPYWTKEQKENVSNKCAMVSGMGEFHPNLIVPKKEYKKKDIFTIGYVGTLNFAKLHKDYFIYCKKVIEKIPNVRFLMVGDYERSILELVKELEIEQYFEFVGFVKDVYFYLEQMDMFGYLLSEDNYATTENAILEAMAFGLPIVAYNNKPEQYIISHRENGFLVDSADNYVDCVKQLADSEKLREDLGRQARYSTIERYSSEQNREVFLKIMQTIMEQEKKQHNFNIVYGETPYEWFTVCTGKDRELFKAYEKSSNEMQDIMYRFLLNCNPTYKEITKSSISHFASYYPEDNILANLEKMVKEIRNSTPGGKRTPLANVLPLSVPYLVQIFPVYGCNFRCGYCIHALDRSLHGYISNKTVMDLDFFKKVIDDMKVARWKIKMLRFAAIGEPLLHKDIAKMVAYAKKADIAESIDIVTNGSLLTRELSDELVKAGLTRLRISLEGLSSQDYKKHASVDVDFETMVENIRYFYEHCGDTKVYIKIIDYMVPDTQTQDKFHKMFQPLCHSLAIEHLTPTIEEIDYNELSGNRENNRPQNGEKLIESSICPQPFYMMQINPDGNVVPCCSMKYPMILGNVLEDSVDNVWNGETYNLFRRNMLDGIWNASEVCKTCTLYRYDLHEEDKLDDVAIELKEKYK